MKIHNETDVCTICDKAFKWTKRNWIREHDLPEVELVTAHAGCRYKMRKLTEKKEKLQQELLGVEWELFNLCYKENKITITNDKMCPLLINGSFYIEH
jgi:hypothetical protein